LLVLQVKTRQRWGEREREEIAIGVLRYTDASLSILHELSDANAAQIYDPAIVIWPWMTSDDLWSSEAAIKSAEIGPATAEEE
jgi:hypothetical protein